MDKRERIARLNDMLRMTLQGGRVVMTRSIAALPDDDRYAVFAALQTFNAFSDDNDPYGEHDCALFDARGHRCLFKIDCYDTDMRFASPDPADPAVTKRVLIVMLAEDY